MKRRRDDGYDLAPCPICGSECWSDGASISCTSEHKDHDARACVYMLDDDDDAPGWSVEAADARLSDAHNRLYRRAELGRLIEKLVPFGFHSLIQEQNSKRYLAGTLYKPHTFGSKSLLDLLIECEKVVDKAVAARGAK